MAAARVATVSIIKSGVDVEGKLNIDLKKDDE
jgi:hypothetical protein